MPLEALPRGFGDLPLSRRLRARALWTLQDGLLRGGKLAARARRVIPDAWLAPLRRRMAPLRVAPLEFESDVPLEASFPLRVAASTQNMPERLSILVPVYGNARLCLRCLRSVQAYSPPNVELVIVDDASPDDSRVVLEAWCRQHATPLHVNAQNLGFPATVNRAAKLAQGELLVILNSDVVVTPGWLEGLCQALRDHPRAGLIGPRGSDTGDVATLSGQYRTVPELEAFAASLAGRRARRVDKLSLFCALVPRRHFEATGGLDEGYDRGMFDDDDLCRALAARGLEVLLCESVFVHHSAGASFRRLSPREYMARFEVNRARFEHKWATHWRAYVPK